MASRSASGSLLADRYSLKERLGSGGMATVYLAEDERLGRRVAVKRLHAGSPEDTAKRFRREARLGASLNHPNIVTVYDTVTDEDSVVIVMEFVDGESLAHRLRRGPVDPREAVRILRGVADALDHAHQNGIVHRDVKPANILLGRSGDVKLVDLGIATAVEGTRITQSDSVMGTAAYMAPEQLDGSAPSPATDVYALAAVAYELLAGRPAYRGVSPVEIAHAVVSGPPPELDGPRGAAEAVRRGMAFRPEDRQPSAKRFVDELERGLEPAPPRRVDRPVAGAPPFDHRPDPGRRLALLAGLMAILLAGGALAIFVLSDDDGNGGSSSSAQERREARAERRREREREQQQQQQQQTETQPQQEQPATPAPAPSEEGQGSSDYQVPQPSGDSADEGAQLQQQGHELIADGDYDQAIPVLERSVQSFPSGTDDLNYAYALYDLGNALRLAGRPEDAIVVLEERMKIDNQRDVVQRELDAARADAGE